jgi:hypothetical protein
MVLVVVAMPKYYKMKVQKQSEGKASHILHF